MNLQTINFARLNHILIPSTKDERDRYRKSRFARYFLRPLTRTWVSLTDEGRGLLGLSMVASLAGLDVIRGQNYWLWAFSFSLLAASLAARPLLALRRVRIDVEGPGRVAVGADAHFGIRIQNEGAVSYGALRVQLPFLPWDGSWVAAERRIAELPAESTVRVEATARFVERGHHHIDAFGVGALIPLGLATGAVLESRGTRFVVVPRITPVRRLSWPERPRHQQGGVALASQTGESSELMGLRAWRDGDRLRDLHARSWARLGEPVVREYQQEYFSRVALLLDDARTEIAEATFEALVSLGAGLVDHLMRGEALIDLTSVSGDGPAITVGRSLGGLDQALDRLAEIRPAGALDAGRAFGQVAALAPRLTAIVFLTTAWDEERAALLDRLAGTGATVRAILVGGAETGAPGDPRVRLVTPAEQSAGRSGEGLWL